jgi:hypothetical protein
MAVKRMNSLVAALNTTRTENGALTNRTSGSKLLNLFGQIGAMRSQSVSDIESTFGSAYREDKALALRCLFYARDVRGGKGERKTFRTILDYLVKNDTNVVIANLDNINFYGRYDDLTRLIDCKNVKVKTAVIAKVKAQLDADMVAEHPSLLAKWMPSINASSKETKALAKKWIRALGMNEAQYRKTLSTLRAKINIVERLMCANEFGAINYEHVPSNAAKLYRAAFKKKDAARYEEYLGAVEKGEKVIKAATLYPYDIVRTYLKNGNYGRKLSVDRTMEAQWKALPDYLKENPHNGLVIADTSGSMFCDNNTPISISVSLALYFAERNVGAFNGFWLNFSSRPTFQMLKGDTLAEKISNMDYSNWQGSTDVDAAFELILSRARSANVPAEEMPSVLYIVSDMQFNCCHSANKTNLETWKEKFSRYGYEMPTIVFWNANARPGQSPVTVNDAGVVLVSGASAETFRSVIEGKNLSAYDLMVHTLSNERYDRVVVD